MRRRYLLVLVLLAADGAQAIERRDATRPSAAEDSAPISLTFDWGEEFRAQTVTTRSRERTPAPPEGNRKPLVSSYEMVATRQPDGSYLVRGLDRRIVLPNGDALPVDERNALELLMSAAVDPDMRVNADGEYVGLADYAALRKVYELAIDAGLEQVKTPDGKQRFRSLMESFMTREAIDVYARQIWDVMVGSWAGAEFFERDPLTTEGSQALPMLGNTEVKFTYTFQLLERVACPGDLRESPPRCVHLQLKTWPDPADIRKIIDEFVKRAAPADKKIPDGMLTDLRIENVMDVITDPNTLKPHSGSIVKRAEVSLIDEGKEETLRQTGTTSVEYRHESPR